MLKNKLNLAVIILNILTCICMISGTIFKSDVGCVLYWIILPFLILSLNLTAIKWRKMGLNPDIDKSKTILKVFDYSTVISTAFYVLMYIVIVFFQTINKSIKTNIYILISVFIMTIIYQLFLFSSISTAKKEMSELLKNKYEKK